MAIQFVQSKQGTPSSGAEIAFSLDSQPIVGNTLILGGGSWTGSPAGKITGIVDTAGNGWSRAVYVNSTSNTEAEIWYTYVASTASPYTITATWDKGNGVGCGACEYSGVLNPTPVDGTDIFFDEAGSTTPSVGSVTPTGNALYVAFISVRAVTTIDKDAAFTERFVTESSAVVDIEYQDLISSGEKSAGWTLGTTIDSTSCIAAFKEAAATRKWLFGARP